MHGIATGKAFGFLHKVASYYTSSFHGRNPEFFPHRALSGAGNRTARRWQRSSECMYAVVRVLGYA